MSKQQDNEEDAFWHDKEPSTPGEVYFLIGCIVVVVIVVIGWLTLWF